MSDLEMTPYELLEQLLAASGTRKRNSLNVIHAVCEEQKDAGNDDFSIATIAKKSAKRGGPKEQSIRNAAGIDYRTLIACWAEYSNGSTKRPTKTPDDPYNKLLQGIQDPAIRAVWSAVLAENKKLRGQVNLLKSNANIVIDQRPVNKESEKLGQTTEFLPSVSSRLTPSEIDALKYSISPEFLNDQGWSSQENGRVVSSKGRAIYKPGYITAIQKVIEDSNI
jgi:hypothetical protein